MTAWTIVAVPLLIMFFALGMERVEARLRQVGVAENDVEEFLEQARPNEVRALFREGISRALELFRLRRRSAQPARRAITAGPDSPRGQATQTRPVAQSESVAHVDAIAQIDAQIDPVIEDVAEPSSRAS